jgi:hypothetical protein
VAFAATPTIEGPGAGQLTVNGNNTSRVFDIQGVATSGLRATAYRHWTFAPAWLLQEISAPPAVLVKASFHFNLHCAHGHRQVEKLPPQKTADFLLFS